MSLCTVVKLPSAAANLKINQDSVHTIASVPGAHNVASIVCPIYNLHDYLLKRKGKIV